LAEIKPNSLVESDKRICEICGMNKAASALGKLAKGIPKRFSQAEIERRKQRLALARAKRWPQK
jgi:hypothetical protein